MQNFIDVRPANDLYLQTSLQISKRVTQAYSSSFSRSLTLVDASIRPAIYAIYGMVRIADEIVDTHAVASLVDARKHLDRFQQDLYEALQNKYSSNPILHAFQWVFHTYHLSHEQVQAFFYSMRLDTEYRVYDEPLYHEYIYGSAEVIGLMSLSVFCKGDKRQEASLQEGARSLGAAFQKVNFLRDIQADFSERKRIYFPGVTQLPLSNQQKQSIEQDIEKDFQIAHLYIRSLPPQARKGVTLAYWYYLKLFNTIKKLPPKKLDTRVRVSRFFKVILYMRALIS